MIDKMKAKREGRLRRHNRVRAKVSGTAEVPRLNVFRSNRALYIQLIDDVSGKIIAGKAAEKNIKKAVFDRGGYQYHGRTQAVAEGAREGGLEF
mgnify:CR=1 FL=1